MRAHALGGRGDGGTGALVSATPWPLRVGLVRCHELLVVASYIGDALQHRTHTGLCAIAGDRRLTRRAVLVGVGYTFHRRSGLDGLLAYATVAVHHHLGCAGVVDAAATGVVGCEQAVIYTAKGFMSVS